MAMMIQIPGRGQNHLIKRPPTPKVVGVRHNIVLPNHPDAKQVQLVMPVGNPQIEVKQEVSPLVIGGLSPEIESFVKDNINTIGQGFKEHYLGFQPLVFEHLAVRVWGKGKAENAVNDVVAFDVDRRMAGFLNLALRYFTEEQHGFSMVPPFIHQRIMRGVVKVLMLDGDGNLNAQKQREKGITVGDIFCSLQREIYDNGLSPKKAAQKVFDSFNLTKDEIRFGRKYFRAGLSFRRSVLHNLKNIAREIALLTYAWEMSNILATQGEQAAKDFLNNLPEQARSLKGELSKILKEEKSELRSKERLQEELVKLDQQAREAREKGNHNKAGRLECQMRELLRTSYYGENKLFASRYRQGKDRPVFLKPGPKSFSEIMTLMVSTGQLPYYYNEDGFLEEEGPMLLRVAEAADEILQGVNPAKKFGFYRELNEEEGKNILEFRDKALEKLSQGLKNYDSVKNLADNELYPLAAVLDGWTTMYLIFDTDNITYEEFMHGLMHADPDYGGILKNLFDVLHRAENYKLIYKNVLVWLQKMRDSKLHGPLAASRNNRGVMPNQITDRDLINLGVPTYLGYAGLAATMTAIWTMHTDFVINAQKTGWPGQRLMMRFFNVEDKNHKLNKIPQLLGYSNLWDATMAMERFLRFGTVATGAFVGLNLLTELTAGGDIGAWGDAVANAFPYFAVPWAAGKAAAYLGGKDYNLYQLVNVPRHYEFDASEDLLYTIFCLARGITVSWDKGHFQQNDCTISLIADMAQKLRWQAQNARLIRTIIAQSLANRKTLDFNAVFDALAPCIYNQFGVAAMANRIGVLGFAGLGLAPMLILNDTIHAMPGQTLLNWIIELSLINYALVEGSIRFSNLAEGTPSQATTLNFGYERLFIPFNVHHVLRRAWSNESAGFNVTGAISVPAKTMLWGSQLDTAPFYMRKNMSWMFLNMLAMAHIAGHAVRDGVVGQDPMSLMAASLLVWLGLDTTYTASGMFGLNDGINPEEVGNAFAARVARQDESLLNQIQQQPLLFDAYGVPVRGGEAA